jgi:hypothetical protein
MAPNKPPSCAAGGTVPSSFSTIPPAEDAPRCKGCSGALLSIVSIQLARCAECRATVRRHLSVVQLTALVDELQLEAGRRRQIRAFDAAADFEMEARLVEALLAKREDISNA